MTRNTFFIVAGVLLVVLIIGFIIFASFVMKRFKNTGSPPSSAALQIARERYARGEISREEFEQIKKDLG